MDVNSPLAMLGGLSPAAFMRLHWQKKPLLVRQAWPGIQPPATRAALFQLAGQDDVESRLVVRNADEWRVRHGPMPRRVLPPLAQPGWTLLVQGLDLHLDDARTLLDASAIGTATTIVARFSLSLAWRASSQRPGRRCSVMARSARSRSAGSSTRRVVPNTTSDR